MARTIDDPSLRHEDDDDRPPTPRPPRSGRPVGPPPRPPRRPRRTRRERPLSAGQVVIVGLICFVVAALLNAHALEDMANRQPLDSFTRDAGRALTKPLVWLSETLRFSEAGEALDEARGREAEGGTGVFTAPTSVPATTAAGTTVAGAPATTAGPTASTTPDVPTKANPLRLYIAGDSEAGALGSSLEPLMDDFGVVDTTLDYKVSSGLTRPDFFDWPARLQEQIGKLKPGIAVMQFGGNDAQALNAPDGKIYQVGDAGWFTEYARRVGAVMDYLSADGRKLIWVGTPNARDEDFNARLTVLRDAMKQEAAKRPAVAFVDTWTMFQSPSGGYADYTVDDDGEAKLMRANDGFHLNDVGSNKLARAVANEVQKEIAARGGTVGG